MRLKPDVIVTGGTMNITALKHATTTIHVVMTWAPDPVGDGLITSLPKPGGKLRSAGRAGTETVAIESAARKLAVTVFFSDVRDAGDLVRADEIIQ